MSRFVFIYHAPTMPSGAPQPSEEEMKPVMDAWQAWAEKVGEGLVDFGTPLADGIRVTKDGTSPSSREVAGYSIIDAENLDTAVELAKIHPHLTMPGGCEIEVHAAQSVPGM
jgi:hypothetical protein